VYRDYVSESPREGQGARTSLDAEGRPIYVGPLARVVLNKEFLNTAGQRAMKRLGVAHLAMLLHDIELVDEPRARPTRFGAGASITEAPRGTLYHGYELDAEGTVTSADIVTPTAHNVAAMEYDVDALVRMIDPEQPDNEPDPASGVRLEAERLLRSYDPCFSCATHFLTVEYRYE